MSAILARLTADLTTLPSLVWSLEGGASSACVASGGRGICVTFRRIKPRLGLVALVLVAAGRSRSELLVADHQLQLVALSFAELTAGGLPVALGAVVHDTEHLAVGEVG